MPNAPTPVAIPVRPDFPVAWEAPEDAELFWVNDRMHFPDPVVPLTADIHPGSGFNIAAERYSLPVRWRSRRINTYLYQAMAPVSTEPAQLAALGRESARRMGEVQARLGTLWTDQWLPEIRRLLQWWDDFNLDAATPAAFLAHLEEGLERYRRLWGLHFQIVMPSHPAMGDFEDLYRELFADASTADAYALIECARHSNAVADLALWRLGREALQQPAVREALEGVDPGQVLPALRRHPEVADFLRRLDAFLCEYGQRSDHLDLAAASWLEDPLPVIAALREHVRRPAWDLEAEYAARAQARQRRLAEARARLQGYPQPVIARFEALLGVAEQAAFLAAEHNFWIDQRGIYRIRRVLLAAGRRLAAAGVLEQAEDVFYLTLAEVLLGLHAPAATDHRTSVAERRAEMERFRVIAAPGALGTPPPPRPDAKPDRFFGGPPPQATEPGTLRGAAGSPGIARGRVRLVHTPAHGAALQPGEVLVAPTTLTTWTPLFARAAAVVTDTGGVLSHAAVVAREYGVPAVVGTGLATSALRDGQMVEVDGDTGTVRMLPG